MFTQCPECHTTFRVTAKVLQQAEGRVRCGGCGSAFNALEHLKEVEAAAEKRDARASTGSASDQNRQLLETLEKLAGPEITIEDTGVEWQVQGDIDNDQGGPETPAMLGRKEDLPHPVSASQESLDLEHSVPPATDPNEIRFDDNTILPDDFGMEDDLDELPFLDKVEPPKRRAGDRDTMRDNPEFEEAQADLALAEPEEWVDLLDEVSDDQEAAAQQEPAVATEAPAAADATPADGEPATDEPPEEEMPSDIDTQFLLQAEEMGLDTGSHQVIAAEVVEEEAAGEALAEGGDEDAESERESSREFEAQFEIATTTLAGEQLEETTRGPAEPALEEEAGAADSDRQRDDIAAAIRGGQDVSKLFDEDSPMVETIVMEGEMISDRLNPERHRPARSASPFKSPGPLEDTYSLSRGKIRGGRRASDPPSHAVIASVIVLALLLAGQVVHQSRQSLVTVGVFNKSIGSAYRLLGKAVTPDWDVRGWQFETTNGSVDEEEDLLTIYSRIANKSEQSLPYPLVHISLTDRWEDVIGSRVLEPGQYLAGDLDPRKPVPPGENFTAVITIESPAAEATGFRLTPCYRIAPGRVRCATQDFKN